MTILLFVACGGGSNQNEMIAEDSGEISFALHWQMPRDETQELLGMQQVAGEEPCRDFAIESVLISVFDDNDQRLLRREWDCTFTTGQLSGIPIDRQIHIVVEAYSDGTLQWRGESKALNIGENFTGDVNQILMRHLGEEKAPPAILAAIPNKDQVQVALNSSIAVRFSEPIDPDSLSGDTFFLLKEGKKILGQVSHYSDALIAVFTADTDFSAEVVYSVVVTADVADLEGNKMARNSQWQFTTGTANDTSPPKVIAVSPGPEERLVPVDSGIRVIFNEDLFPASVNETTFFLTTKGSATSGRIVCSGQTATFTPLESLAPNTTYQAVITTVVEDLCGNSLENDYSWQFTTASDISSALTLNFYE
jgi:hypothetical protein